MIGWTLLIITLLAMAVSLFSMAKVDDLGKEHKELQKEWEIEFHNANKFSDGWIKLISMIFKTKCKLDEWQAIKFFSQFAYLTGAYLTFWVLVVGWFCG